MNLNKPKLLIYIVAFNHEKFILNVLKRIPLNLSKKYEVEILINDDSSEDKTFDLSNQYAQNAPTNFKFKRYYVDFSNKKKILYFSKKVRNITLSDQNLIKTV